MAETIRVVIVDDERLFAELLRVALRAAEGIEVLAVVHDLKSAIAALNEHRPDVVIADYHLPDGTGADLARAVRGSLPDTSVLVLTADPSAVTLNDVARSGAVGHMTKGRGLTEVVESVRAAASGEILFAPSELQRLLLESACSGSWRAARARPPPPSPSASPPRRCERTCRPCCESSAPTPASRRSRRQPASGS